MPIPEYQCRKCEKIYTIEQYRKDPFCPDDGMRLWPKFTRSKPKTAIINPIAPTPEVNLATIFAEFNGLENFTIGTSIESIPLWLTERLRAYDDFRNRLTQDKLVSFEKICYDYKQFLYLENNRSWSNLHRTGLKALDNPEKLWKLITYIQDETIPIQDRITDSLKGQYYVHGVGRNIVTGLLHMFYPDKYGVWNSRTEDTLNLLRRKPVGVSGTGNLYVAVNEELKKLAKELDTNLTIIDGLMWYVSKRLKSQLIG